jgi:ribose-phosphate pyrophosphokinase
MIKVNDVLIEQNSFPDSTLLVKFDPHANEYNYQGRFDIDWLYESDAELFTIICLKRHIDEHCANARVVLNMPYLPHARMDRVKNANDVFTLKYFCEVINSLNFYGVMVLDAHSNVGPALLNNLTDMSAGPYIATAINKSKADVLFFPDEGAMKRYSWITAEPYAFGLKDRDWATGQIKGLTLVNGDAVKGKDVLIVDDICSRGGTFYHSAKALKAAGANKIYLYVSHCEKTIFKGDLFEDGLIEKIYTSESILPAEMATGKIEII